MIEHVVLHLPGHVEGQLFHLLILGLRPARADYGIGRDPLDKGDALAALDQQLLLGVIPDVDGDNQVLATTDSWIHARIALGITGNAVVSGITFPLNATRKTWPLIRDYLVRQCGMSLAQ